jgi:hypothetical protein
MGGVLFKDLTKHIKVKPEILTLIEPTGAVD